MVSLTLCGLSSSTEPGTQQNNTVKQKQIVVGVTFQKCLIKWFNWVWV